MKPLLLAVILLFVIIGCKKKQAPTFYTYQYQFYQDKGLKDTALQYPDTTIYQAIIKDTANCLVFNYLKTFSPPSGYVDGGTFQRLLFEVNPLANNFTYNMQDSSSYKIRYEYWTNNTQVNYIPMVKENITGQKLSANEWIISADIIADHITYQDTISFTNKHFILAP